MKANPSRPALLKRRAKVRELLGLLAPWEHVNERMWLASPAHQRQADAGHLREIFERIDRLLFWEP